MTKTINEVAKAENKKATATMVAVAITTIVAVGAKKVSIQATNITNSEVEVTVVDVVMTKEAAAQVVSPISL